MTAKLGSLRSVRWKDCRSTVPWTARRAHIRRNWHLSFPGRLALLPWLSHSFVSPECYIYQRKKKDLGNEWQLHMHINKPNWEIGEK